MYIRNNQPVPPGMANTTDPPKVDDWIVEVTGLVDKPLTLRLSQLKNLPATEFEMVLQCSGNGRSFFSKYARASGAQWERGSLANVRWKGVKLATLLQDAGIKAEARFLTAEGADQPASATAADIERSIPLADVLANAILAYEMNGEPLPTVHGGPLRLVIPGYYGINNIKWVNKLRLEAAPSNNNTMIPRYRVPNNPIAVGSSFQFTLENSRPNWKQNVKAIIFSPTEGEAVSGIIEVRGAAWNDGAAPITSVEVSTNGGRSWQTANLEKPSSPYGWYLWRLRVLVAAGDTEVWARATDALGRSQPIDGAIFWNPNGYEWNAVDKVKIKVG
jgi:DMSO/TMAO reductase YedYZ molybdopterin-dependent catalytic subunit